MKGLIQCGFCGKITVLTRTDKCTCSNACAVKLIYYRAHNFETPLQNYLKLMEGGNNTISTVTSNTETSKNNDEEIVTPVLNTEKIHTFKTPSFYQKAIYDEKELDEKLEKYTKSLKQIKYGK